MDPDDFKQAWRAQSSPVRLSIDAKLLLKEVRRNENQFNVMIRLRDMREIGVSLVMIPVWIYLGLRNALPWTWYLAVPGLVWIAGFMLIDRRRHPQRPPDASETVRECVARSLAHVEHQIWLLRNVLWWYLLPLLVPILAFFSQIAWRQRQDGWLAVVFLAIGVLIQAIVFGGIYWLNQVAVRKTLMPRRDELAALLASLGDEAQDSDP